MLDELAAAAPEAPEKLLEGSEWLTDKTERERAKIEKAMLEKLLTYVDSAKKLLGEPDGDTEAVALWYPEALASHAWTVDDGIYALSVVNHDRDTPIGISLRYVTKAERDELAKNSPMAGYFDDDDA